RQRRTALAEAQREVEGLVRLARAALNAGNTRKAARLRLAIEQGVAGLPAVPAPLARGLQQLDERLNELRQWKDYAVAPKRIELIEEMEALIGADEPPETLAEHIRALQQEWRTVNQGIASDASAETERFQKAYQAAYRPCQEYHAAQAAVRRENLAARLAVLERLRAVLAGQQAEDADRALLAQVLREAPREWYRHAPVDRAQSRAAELEFQRVLEALRALLGAWHERNEADKRALIEAAASLAALEDPPRAVDGIKRLQARWRETGPVPRERSEALWAEFRGHCDAVFARRQQVNAQQAAALAGAREAAVALCEQVERAAGGEGEALRARIGEWRAAHAALGELPATDARALHDRFERALARFEQRLGAQQRRDAAAAVTDLLEAARRVGEYARARATGAAEEQRAALRAQAESFIAGVARWPAGGQAAARQALARADAGPVWDASAQSEALRLLCVRAEILAGLPSPPEDEARRREYQLQRLLAGIGQAVVTDGRDWDALLLEWVGAGTAEPAEHAALERRFLTCLERRPAADTPAKDAHGRGGAGREPRPPREERSRPPGRGRTRPGPRG
ncbi:MAG: DUF349 domain-containing protein, partial [Proteobacteria bacterium]|nr:DUF349 domain-containing protein [Pseudomonadota bacterium]